MKEKWYRGKKYVYLMGYGWVPASESEHKVPRWFNYVSIVTVVLCAIFVLIHEIG